MGTQEITLRVSAEGCPDLTPLWDSVITVNAELEIDWALAGPEEGVNYGGLQAKQALATAIILQVWTDKWSKANEVAQNQDPRGWWGNDVDQQGYPEMGCELWTLFRGRLNSETAGKARDYVLKALQVLVDQGAVARFDVQALTDEMTGSLVVNIQGYSQTGANVYDQKWSFIWKQLVP